MITRPPRPVVHLPQGMVGVDTTSDRQAEVTQEAQRAGVVACTWERRGGPGPRRVIGTRPQRTEVRRPHSVPSRRGAGTHQQVGAAIISFRHCSRGAPSASARRPQYPTFLRGTHNNPNAGHAQQAAYIGQLPFPTDPAKFAPHWANRDHA